MNWMPLQSHVFGIIQTPPFWHSWSHMAKEHKYTMSIGCMSATPNWNWHTAMCSTQEGRMSEMLTSLIYHAFKIILPIDLATLYIYMWRIAHDCYNMQNLTYKNKFKTVHLFDIGVPFILYHDSHMCLVDNKTLHSDIYYGWTVWYATYVTS